MKAYKSLQIYIQVTEGLVRNVKINLSENELTVVKEKVGYATVQRLPRGWGVGGGGTYQFIINPTKRWIE